MLSKYLMGIDQTRPGRYGALAAGLLALALAGCSGSGGDAVPAPVNQTPPPAASGDCSTNPDDCGVVYIGLTDADGDFLSYSVEVLQLTLERADGAVVAAMPRSASVDFAQYTELTEFLSAATVPPGTYVSGTLTLDYGSAQVFVELDALATQAVVVGAGGQPLGVESFTVRLSDRDRLIVRPGVPAVMVVDFDLNASHKVDVFTDPVTVTAEPFLLADIDPAETKTMRARGPLVGVDTDAATYTIQLRPFYLPSGAFGRFTVHTSDVTEYEIDGERYSGANGLRALSVLASGTPTVATGVLDVARRRYEATQVFAGTSVPGSGRDVLEGHVFARTGNRISVRGATHINGAGTVIFNDSVAVLIDDTTDVVKTGDPDFSGGIDSVSVGQRVSILGEVTSETAGELAMDASQGRIRLLPTRMSGVVETINSGLITVDLQAIGGRDPARFDFSGTGSTGQDASADEYEVDIGALSLDLVPPAPVRFSGFVADFGLAPPDFFAGTVVGYGEARARLDIGWLNEATDQFLALDETGIVFNLDNESIGNRHHLRRGGIVQDLADLAPPPSVVARDDPAGLFAIRDGVTVQVYTAFADFTAALATHLAEGRAADGLHAVGGYDDASGVFSARRIAVRLD